VFTVVICAYVYDRFDELSEAVESVLAQTYPAQELLVVIDNCDELLTRMRAEFPQVRVIANDGDPGTSSARNTGLRHATAPVVAFLDDDAWADPGWLEALAPWYEDPNTIGVGGHIEPRWEGERPAWFPAELLWVVGGTHRGTPTSVAPVRNFFGSNMSFRREALLAVGGLKEELGRVGRTGWTCEETELAIRVAQSQPGSVLLHVPEARVEHQARHFYATWRYFVQRCWGEGRAKALVTQHVGPGAGLSSERAYVARVLPAGFVRGLWEAVRGDVAGLARSAAIVLGLSATTAGYVYGSAVGRAAR
jgi:cellulose synthase/poly-beta-1,6-N-acetylglucosamine synthase-like glycosyltransferase